ncbi:CoA transferase [Candidatus Sodalis endolongispinus]|uniref:CoA transferase n=1 Tax=Candidatus Sodalis endolongispinus TaxID=2812662 RepID=A0ABS5YCY6_9GAMM|nr:CaiB/BaiF CoA-transferase family protein [Candidatus Sodalis endolongispinus]MBT9432894.1 CoA transferase [Candidatus Sodalis endolongispinus]
MSILAGYRVLDCSIAMAGPFAALRMGDMGADVIKVEPTTGEWQRHTSAGGAYGNIINTSFLSLNRNKRSLAVNLKQEEGRALLYRLVATSDVFIQNYRPGVAARLGVDYDTLKKIKPDLVYVSMSGYGETGPYAKRPGQDLLLQSLSGAMLSTGVDGTPPQPSGQYVVDAITAYTAFEGALAALLHRDSTGEGQLVQINMLDVIIANQMQEMTVFTQGRKPQRRSEEPHGHCYILAPYGVFRTKDSFITLVTPHLPTLGKILDVPELAAMDDEIDGHTLHQRDFIFRVTREKLRERTTQAWRDLFDAEGLWSSEVYGYEEVVADPQVIHNVTFIEYDHPSEGKVKTPGFAIKFSKTPCSLQRPTPFVGQHTDEILTELGFSEQKIAALKETGTVTHTQGEIRHG